MGISKELEFTSLNFCIPVWGGGGDSAVPKVDLAGKSTLTNYAVPHAQKARRARNIPKSRLFRRNSEEIVHEWAVRMSGTGGRHRWVSQ